MTDLGTNFTLRLLKQVCDLLGIQMMQTSVYHSQIDSLAKEAQGHSPEVSPRELCYWDQLILLLLFAVQEVLQSSTKFSPFKLLYGRPPWGLLDLCVRTESRHLPLCKISCSMSSNCGTIWRRWVLYVTTSTMLRNHRRRLITTGPRKGL